MVKDDMKQVVETLLKRAAATSVTAPEALNFSQAACNAANAIRVLEEIKLFKPGR